LKASQGQLILPLVFLCDHGSYSCRVFKGFMKLPNPFTQNWRAYFKGRLWKDLLWTLCLQVGGRLFQFIGVMYALECLGDFSGESREALRWAHMLQFILTLGLDIVAVRHMAAKTVSFETLVPRIFTARLIIYGLVGLVWMLGILSAGLTTLQTQLWLAAVLNLVVLGMNFQWVFQGAQRMPAFSVIQTSTSLAISAYFLILFKPGIQMGADLWVMGIIQGLVTLVSWYYIKRRYRLTLLCFNRTSELKAYFIEGSANWIFGIFYNLLSSIGMITIRQLTQHGPFANHEDPYSKIDAISMAVQSILVFGGSVIYTRIVVWKNERDDYFSRITLVTMGIIAAGIVSCTFLHWAQSAVISMGYSISFVEAAPYMSWLVFGRFMGLASGVLVWGLLAYRLDWTAVKCAVAPVLVSAWLHFLLVPKYGLKATVFLNVGGEIGLFLCCLVAFKWLENKQSKMSH